jgi:hypothetical protein
MVIKDLTEQAVLQGLKGSLDQIEDKRVAERYQMLNYYEGISSEMVFDIKKYFDSDSLRQTPVITESITTKLINARAIVYKQTPERNVDEKYLDFVDDLDSSMLQFERMTYLLGTSAMKSVWDEEAQLIKYVPLVEFYPIFLPYEENPVACIYPLYNHSNNVSKYDQMFAFWSEDSHFLINGKGVIVDVDDNPERINPYGIMPIAFAHRQILTTDWFREGASDIVAMNRTINVMLTEMSLAMRLQMLGQPVITGIDEASRLKMGVDKPIILSEGANFEFKSPGGNLSGYVDAMRFLVDSVAYNHNLKTKWSVGRESMVSGEALKMAEIELTESIKLDAQMIWRPFEKDRFEIDRAIIEYEANTNIDDEYSIDFSEPRFPLSANEERLQWDWEWANGLSAKEDWFKAHNPDATQDQIEDMVEEAGGKAVEEEEPEDNAFNLKKALTGG